jgi:hypothetical protein
MSIGCSCLEFVTLGSAFLCFGKVVEFDLLDGSISGVVFDLGSVQTLTYVYTVSKSPMPAPSSHWTLLLILEAGTREPRMQRLVLLAKSLD